MSRSIHLRCGCLGLADLSAYRRKSRAVILLPVEFINDTEFRLVCNLVSDLYILRALHWTCVAPLMDGPRIAVIDCPSRIVLPMHIVSVKRVSVYVSIAFQ